MAKHLPMSENRHRSTWRRIPRVGSVSGGLCKPTDPHQQLNLSFSTLEVYRRPPPHFWQVHKYSVAASHQKLYRYSSLLKMCTGFSTTSLFSCVQIYLSPGFTSLLYRVSPSDVYRFHLIFYRSVQAVFLTSSVVYRCFHLTSQHVYRSHLTSVLRCVQVAPHMGPVGSGDVLIMCSVSVRCQSFWAEACVKKVRIMWSHQLFLSLLPPPSPATLVIWVRTLAFFHSSDSFNITLQVLLSSVQA